MKTFAPGFRLSTMYIVVLIIGLIGGAACLQVDVRLGAAVWYVVAHFFLFCNVLRMSRSLELLWAGVFAGLVIAAAAFQWFAWPVVLGVSLSVTVLFAATKVRKPSYHGVCWEWLNPRLPEWWHANHASEVRASE